MSQPIGMDAASNSAPDLFYFDREAETGEQRKTSMVPEAERQKRKATMKQRKKQEGTERRTQRDSQRKRDRDIESDRETDRQRHRQRDRGTGGVRARKVQRD